MSKFMDWVDARFPATKMWEDHLSKYYAPKNFNFFYFFGSLALPCWGYQSSLVPAAGAALSAKLSATLTRHPVSVLTAAPAVPALERCYLKRHDSNR